MNTKYYLDFKNESTHNILLNLGYEYKEYTDSYYKPFTYKDGADFAFIYINKDKQIVFRIMDSFGCYTIPDISYDSKPLEDLINLNLVKKVTEQKLENNVTHKYSILTLKEQLYLYNIIKPFIYRVEYIRLVQGSCKDEPTTRIVIKVVGEDSLVQLPEFVQNAYCKNMELNKKYSLIELFPYIERVKDNESSLDLYYKDLVKRKSQGENIPDILFDGLTYVQNIYESAINFRNTCLYESNTRMDNTGVDDIGITLTNVSADLNDFIEYITINIPR